MSITKNHQSAEALRALCEAAFPGRAVAQIAELTEGMFNAAYRVDFADGGAYVLKIAAADASGLLSNEIGMMQAEVAAMRSASLPYTGWCATCMKTCCATHRRNLSSWTCARTSC